MSKKVLALLLAAAMATAALASCGGNDNNDDTSDTSKDTSVDTSVDTAGDDTAADDGTATPTVDETITDIHEAIKEAYGEGYIPNMPIDSEMLSSTYGIDPVWVESYVAEMPMIMTHVDTLIIIKPTKDNTDNVLGALQNYYSYLVNDSMQYPMNIEKVRAAQVFEKNGYVFFFMLGMLSDEAIYAEGTEEEIASIQYNEAVANNRKALDAINSVLGE